MRLKEINKANHILNIVHIYLIVVEVQMPAKGKELRINHGLDVNNIISVNVIIINGSGVNQILRSQVDLISQKVLYNWYVDKEHFVLIHPNNVKVLLILARLQR